MPACYLRVVNRVAATEAGKVCQAQLQGYMILTFSRLNISLSPAIGLALLLDVLVVRHTAYTLIVLNSLA